MNKCIFCDIIAGKIPSKTIHTDEKCIAFKDISPQTPHHLLIIPRKHFENVLSTDKEDNELIGHLVTIAKNLAEKKGFANNGFRLVFNCNKDGGQAVDHLHLHLLGGRQMNWPPG